jgi:CheY-like chemotaxis protein
MGIAGKVLLVEDSADDEALVQRALRAFADVRIEVVRDGEEALQVIASEAGSTSLKLVLLDLRLPKIGGVEVLERLQAVPAARTLPIVVLTCVDRPEDEQHCLKLGANGYIRKVTRFDAMEKTLQETVSYWLNTDLADNEDALLDPLYRVDMI